MKTYEDLADLVGRFLDKNGLSEKELAGRSGGEISQGYINNIKNRKVKPEDITIKKLRVLARGMRVSETQIIDLARGTNKQTSLSKQFIELFESLSQNRQADILSIAWLFAEEKTQTFPIDSQTEALGISQEELVKGKHMKLISRDEIEFEESDSEEFKQKIS